MYVQASNVIYAHICGNQRSVSDVFPKEPFALLFKRGSLTGNWGLLSGLLIKQSWLVSELQGFLLVSEPPKAGITSTYHQTQVLYRQRCNLGTSSCLLDKHFTY